MHQRILGYNNLVLKINRRLLCQIKKDCIYNVDILSN